MKKIAVLTPTYNRANTLPKLFQSLKAQTDKNFVWYVVDDGSLDDTESLIENYKKNTGEFSIIYLKKQNGGKHTALNVGIKEISEYLTIIVDSDDYLTSDAIETIHKDYDLIKDKTFCGISYLKGKDEKTPLWCSLPEDFIIGSNVETRYNRNIKGDMAEVFKTDILKQFPFPEIACEKFISEAVVWAKMSGPYKILYKNNIIYIAEYRKGGLTDNSHKLIFNNPKGACLTYNVLSGRGFNLKNKIKYTLLYATSAITAKNKKIIKNSSNPALCFFLMPFAWALYLRRKKKFGVKNGK